LTDYVFRDIIGIDRYISENSVLAGVVALKHIREKFSFQKIFRIALAVLHTALAIGLTIYSAITVSDATNAEHVKAVCVIAWANFAASLLMSTWLSHITKRELYWLIGGFDDSQPFDKNVLNAMLGKMINAIIISLLTVTLSQIPFLLITGNFPVELHIGLLCGLYFLMLVWVVVIVIKYHRKAKEVNKR
jgi:hypothetical protein